MFVLSWSVVVVVALAISGHTVDPSISSHFEVILPKETHVSEVLLMVSFFVGAMLTFTPIRKAMRYISTLVHELGHAFTAGVLGGRPRNITISVDSSGLATYLTPPGWGRMRATIVTLAGYPAPAIAALAAVRAVQSGHPRVWFMFAVTTLTFSVVLLFRNLWGFLWTAGLTVASFFIGRLLDASILGLLVGGIAGYLVAEGYLNAREQLAITKSVRGSGCDAEQVAGWWWFSSRFVARLHLISVAVLGGYTTYVVVSEYAARAFS